MYCSNCGKAIKDTDLYCSSCGHKVGNDERRHEPVNEEIIYNPPKPDKEPFVFGRREQASTHIPSMSDLHDRADASAKPPKPCEGDFDFVWNVHKFPEAGPKEIEKIDFDWNPKPAGSRTAQPATGESAGTSAGFSSFTSDESKEKFNTYNKSREEFQKLLDREYVRLGQKSTAGETAAPAEVPRYESAAAEEPEPFDPIKHLQEMEIERKKERDLFYAELDQQDYIESDEALQPDTRRFDTIELQKDMLQVDMDEAAKTQIIERIKYGASGIGATDDFDIKKTQFYQKQEYEQRMEEPEPQVESRTMEIPIGITDMNIAAEAPAPMETSAPPPDADAAMQERLKHLWDSNTAPIPVQSIPAQAAAAYSNGQTAQTEEKATPHKEEKGGNKLIKFFIALIIVVLVLEGTVLGLRYFAPESEATKKVNYTITLIQDWIKTTFSGKADNTAAN